MMIFYGGKDLSHDKMTLTSGWIMRDMSGVKVLRKEVPVAKHPLTLE